jgi:Tol biopolymer transport system component
VIIEGGSVRRPSGAGWLIATLAAVVVVLGLAAPASGSAPLSSDVEEGGGQSAFAASELIGTSAIVGNSSFEGGVSGWNVSGSDPGVSLSRVAGGHGGDWAAQLSNDGGAATCLLNDAPNWVTATGEGAYTASLWVRSDVAGATLKLKVREYNTSGGLVDEASSAIVLTTSWQPVSVPYVPKRPGSSALDYTAYVHNAAAGTCFEADDAAIVFHPPPKLDVTRTMGLPPVSVHGDASASTAADPAIASYTFDFGDGSARVGPQIEPTADHSYAFGGRHDVTVTITYTGGGSLSTSRSVYLTANEIANSTFEDPIFRGWNTSGSSAAVTLTQVPGGHGDRSAARLSNAGAVAADCVLNDAPNWVAATGAGRYTASLWVRSDAAGATLKLRLREYRKDTGALLGSASSAITLTTGWQQVKVAYTPLAQGASTLDYTASVSRAAAGTACFDAGDAALYFEPTPAASLGVTPATGTAPLWVTADASGSAQPAVGYRFDFGDGTARVETTSSWAEHSYAASGTYTVALTVTYGNGESASATRQVSVGAGIVANPSFESGTSGWNVSGSGSGVTLTQATGGHSGVSEARLANRGTAAANCVLNDAPNWLATTAAGTWYTASLWVRSDSPGAKLTLRLREYRKDNGAFVAAASNAITLTTAWQHVSVAYRPLTPGASSLDYTASVDHAAAGSGCFDADDATIAPTPTAGATRRVSVSSADVEATNASTTPAISADGRFVAFVSEAPNLVDDTNSVADVFVRDRQTGKTQRVSVSTAGAEANGASNGPAISADGRYIAFTSAASNLVAGDTNHSSDVFVYDRETGETRRVSVSSDGVQGTSSSSGVAISADGRHVGFASSAPNLVPDDTNSGPTNSNYDLFVHDLGSGQTQRVSVSSDGAQAVGNSFAPSLSADGRYVAFMSNAPDLVADDTNHSYDIFMHDNLSGETQRLSVTSTGGQVNDASQIPKLSADGRYVVFRSWATNLGAGGTTGRADLFLHDRQTGATRRVNVSNAGAPAEWDGNSQTISADGRYVGYTSGATNLAAGDTRNASQAYVHDAQTGATRRVSVNDDGVAGNGSTYGLSLSADGRYVAFASDAPDLVNGDTNNARDIFVHDIAASDAAP